jgi:hypothetical protein
MAGPNKNEVASVTIHRLATIASASVKVPESRMRENRPYDSEGGESGSIGLSYPYS